MNDHDKFCPYNYQPPDRLCAMCMLLSQARADERERIEQGIKALPNDLSDWDKGSELIISYTRWQAYGRCLNVVRSGNV